MSEVPFLDSSCLGPDLTTFNEDELLRYFLNDDLEHSPFDSKVPSSSPLLDPPNVSLVSPLPKQSHSSAPVVVKKEQSTTPTKASNAKSRSKNQTTSTVSNTKQSTPTPSPVPPPPLPSPSVPGIQSTSKTSLAPTVQPSKLTKPPTQIHPITVNATQPTDSPVAQLLKSSTASPIAAPLSPLDSPVGDDEKSVKRQRRLLKNRESAQLSRIRKKMYIDELERKVNALVSENTGLREEVVHLNDVLKQVAGTEVESAKGPLSRAEIIKAISSSNGSSSSSHARKYAGVCLLVVLFSLGLFLNVVPANNNGQISNRLLELDSHSNNHNKNSSSTASASNNNNAHFRDYKVTKTETESALARKEKSKNEDEDEQSFSSKRAWGDDANDFISFPSPKRIKTEESMDSESGDLDERDPLFDVLEDDAFSEDGMLTTSTSPTSPGSMVSSAPSSPIPSSSAGSSPPLSPASLAMVPFTPPVPPVLNTPPQTPLTSQNSTNSPIVAVVVPSYLPPSADSSNDQPTGILHVHLWSFMRNTVM